MATSFNYTTLKAAILGMTEESGSEFTAYIDTIIPLAEDRLLRDLDLEIFDVTGSTVFTGGNPLLTKPANMVALRSIWFTDANGNFNYLEPRSFEYCRDYWPKAATTTATPKFYAEYSETEWIIAGTPSSGLAVTHRIIKRPAGMTSGNPTTWLGSNAGDLLLYACLIGSEEYLKADNRVPVWTAEYNTRLAGAREELTRTTRSDYMPMTATPKKE